MIVRMLSFLSPLDLFIHTVIVSADLRYTCIVWSFSLTLLAYLLTGPCGARVQSCVFLGALLCVHVTRTCPSRSACSGDWVRLSATTEWRLPQKERVSYAADECVYTRVNVHFANYRNIHGHQHRKRVGLNGFHC